jgi:hypothetical protein
LTWNSSPIQIWKEGPFVSDEYRTKADPGFSARAGGGAHTILTDVGPGF